MSLSDIVKFDHLKGIFVYSPPENSNPFLWYVNRNPSIFATDPAFMTRKTLDVSRNQSASTSIKTQRDSGANPCQLYGLSKKADERMRETKEAQSFKTQESKK